MIEYRIRFARRAREDMIAIGDYIAFQLLQPDISKSFIKELRQSISQLKLFPYKFPVISDIYLKESGIRCMPHKNYYVFYKVDEEQKCVIVLRVGYNRRNWRNILK